MFGLAVEQPRDLVGLYSLCILDEGLMHVGSGSRTKRDKNLGKSAVNVV